MDSRPLAEKKEIIVGFIRELVRSSGSKGVIVGLSGGLDSALVTSLCAQALGPERVYNIYLPSPTSPLDDEASTHALSRLLGTNYEVVRIDPAVTAIANMLHESEDRLAIGNMMARTRMIVLYHLARKRGLLVMGTGNRSELMMGYFTKHGDGACDALPIGRLYKTEVRSLSAQLGLPEEFITRPPSAGLWQGQTDEDEMGITYPELDSILMAMEKGMDLESIHDETGISRELISTVLNRVQSNAHKRSPVPFPW